MRGIGEGRYPYHYLEMIENLFGVEKDTIEVCSGSIHSPDEAKFTVDINPITRPDFVSDAQHIDFLQSSSEPQPQQQYSRWRCDPPYNEKRAKGFYGTDLPNPGKLLTAGARVLKKDSLMFLLLGPKNYQRVPKGVKRIGLIFITVIPNNEIRCLNIYHKFE